MIEKPDASVVEALVSLRNNRDFNVITDWLQRSLSQTAEQLIDEANPDSVRRQQGEASTLREFLHHAENAKDYMDKMR